MTPKTTAEVCDRLKAIQRKLPPDEQGPEMFAALKRWAALDPGEVYRDEERVRYRWRGGIIARFAPIDAPVMESAFTLGLIDARVHSFGRDDDNFLYLARMDQSIPAYLGGPPPAG